jgi:hypothetical protein
MTLFDQLLQVVARTAFAGRNIYYRKCELMDQPLGYSFSFLYHKRHIYNPTAAIDLHIG